MARVDVSLPDDLAARAREAGLDVSSVTQDAVRRALAQRSTDAWLAGLAPASDRVPHERVTSALAEAPIARHAVPDLLVGGWARRHQIRLADALYVHLAVSLDATLVSTDRRLRAAPAVEVVDA